MTKKGNLYITPQCENCSEKEEQICSICLSEYKKNEEICYSRNPACPHMFHKECILEWIMHNNECPNCRQVFLDPTFDDPALGEETVSFCDVVSQESRSNSDSILQLEYQMVDNNMLIHTDISDDATFLTASENSNDIVPTYRFNTFTNYDFFDADSVVNDIQSFHSFEKIKHNLFLSQSNESLIEGNKCPAESYNNHHKMPENQIASIIGSSTFLYDDQFSEN